MHDEYAWSHSLQGYLRDAMGITMPNSWNMLSETSAVTFFGFFNFVFSPLWKGCWHGPLWSRKRVNFRRWRGQITIVFNSSFVTPGKPAWLRINFHSGKLSTLWDAVSLLPPAPTLISRWVTSRSNVANGRVTAGSDGLLSRVPHMSSSFQKVHRILMFLIFQETKLSYPDFLAPLPFKRTQMKQIHLQTEKI